MLKKKDKYKIYTIIKKKNYTVIVINFEKYIFLRRYKNIDILLDGKTRKHRRIYYLASKMTSYLQYNEKYN